MPKTGGDRVPRKPLKPCKYPNCPKLTEGNYCEVHQSEMEYKPRRKSYNRLYSTSRWKAIRLHILSKQPLCTQCMKTKRITPATVVDHVNPHKGNEELFYDKANLQPLCKSCHDRKTAKEDGRWNRRVYTY